MKLAAALMRRADLQTQINELETRLHNNARVQDGEKPAESPAELIASLDAAIAEQESLIAQINLTNAQTVSTKVVQSSSRVLIINCSVASCGF